MLRFRYVDSSIIVILDFCTGVIAPMPPLFRLAGLIHINIVVVYGPIILSYLLDRLWRRTVMQGGSLALDCMMALTRLLNTP
jgi:hypothetical protein